MDRVSGSGVLAYGVALSGARRQAWPGPSPVLNTVPSPFASCVASPGSGPDRTAHPAPRPVRNGSPGPRPFRMACPSFPEELTAPPAAGPSWIAFPVAFSVTIASPGSIVTRTMVRSSLPGFLVPTLRSPACARQSSIPARSPVSGAPSPTAAVAPRPLFYPGEVLLAGLGSGPPGLFPPRGCMSSRASFSLRRYSAFRRLFVRPWRSALRPLSHSLGRSSKSLTRKGLRIPRLRVPPPQAPVFGRFGRAL